MALVGRDDRAARARRWPDRDTESAGAQPLIANRVVVDVWETFDFIDNADGSVSFRAHANGLYVDAPNGGAHR